MKCLRFLCTTLLLLCCIAVHAQEFEVDGIYYSVTHIYNGNPIKAQVVKGPTEYSGHIIIPSHVPSTNNVNCEITGIRYNAFSNCTGLISIEIPNSVTSIEWEAFMNCTSLTSIEIPNLVTRIEGSVFKGCTSLTNVVIPNSVTSIGGSAFEGCTGLTSIEIPNSVTNIGASAFKGCTSLTNVEIPNSVTSIGSEAFEETAFYHTLEDGLIYFGELLYTYKGEMPENTVVEIKEGTVSIADRAFEGCEELVGVTIPSSVTSIGDSAFEGCTGLTSVTIPSSVTSIGNSAFKGCAGLTSITIPSGVKRICGYVFEGCTGLTNVTLPDNITDIDPGVFMGCTSLTSITLPKNITEISGNLFLGCANLTSITIPSKVTLIGWCAFMDCAKLTEVIALPTAAPELEWSVFEGIGSAVLTYPENSNYLSWAQYFSNFERTQTDASETWIVDDAGNALVSYTYVYDFWNDWSGVSGYAGDREKIRTVTVEEGFTRVEYGAFSDYINLTSVVLPENITAIEDNAFAGCFSLSEIYLPKGLQSIGGNAFGSCESLTSIYLPDGLTEIGADAFSYTQIPAFVVPTTVTKIGNKAFSSMWTKDGDWGYSREGSPYVIFKSFNPPYIDGTLDNIACIHESAVFPHDYFDGIEYFKTRQEYVWFGWEKLFVFGEMSEVGDVDFSRAQSVLFMPDLNSSSYEFILTLPNIEKVDVVSAPKIVNETPLYYSRDGSNAIFINYYDTDYGYGTGEHLVVGCKATVIPDGTRIIGDGAFSGCTELKDIHIPNSVRSIASGAFQNCSNLTNINFPDGLQIIDYYAFSGCTGLTEIIIPSKEVTLGYYAFSGCNGLVSATINGKQIGIGCFASCTNLSTLNIGSDISAISNESFLRCTALKNITVDAQNATYDSRNACNAIIETATNKLVLASNNALVPAEVTAIGANAFTTCPDLDVTVPTAVTEIETDAFKGVGRLLFEGDVPVTITGNVFGWGAIYVPSASYETYCNAPVWSEYKDRIVTPELANRDIEVYSTEGMSGILDALGLNDADRTVKLKVKGEINSYDIIMIRDKMPLLNELDLSEAKVVPSSKPFYQDYCTGKNSLAGYAFYDLDKLLTVKLPKELTILGDYAFAGCDKLLSVDASKTGELNIGNYALNKCVKLHEFVSPEKISEVGSYAFSGSTKLENIELRNIAGSIGEYAFQGCDKLNTIDIASIGGDIQQYAFKNCNNLEDVTVGIMGGNLNDKAFGYCPALKNVVFAQGPVRIGTRVFEYSDALETFIAGEGNKVVDREALKAVKLEKKLSPFGGYVWVEVEIDRINLKTITLPQTTETIGNNAFAKCTALSNFTMPQGVTTIGTSAFNKCQALERISIPDGVTHVPNQAFYGCSALTDVSFSNNVTTIGTEAFSGCSALKNATFSDYLTRIESGAFAGCGFENLKLPPTLITIENDAFANCTNLVELHIPSAVENIGSKAFSGCSKLNDIYTYTVEPTTITETTFSTFTTATLHVPMTSFWNYYWDIGWSRFNHKLFQDFNKPYDYFYLNNDYYLNGSTGYIEGTPDADMRPGSGLIVDRNEEEGDAQQNLGDVTVGSDGNGNSGAIIGDENLFIENLHVKINVKKGRWYFFAFPWDVPFKNISMQKGSDYVFRYYDGEERATNGNGGWKNVNESHLKAARGYIFQSSADDVLMISIEKVKFKKEDKYNELITYVSDNLNDASWNLMGNPYLSYYDMGAMNYSAPVTVWDGEKYVAIRPGDDDYQFSPYEAFFVQKPEGTETVGFSAEEQMTKTQSETLKAQQAKARLARKVDVQRLLVNLVLEHDSVTDRTRVVFNNRQKMAYETACDAAKFETAGVPQLYTLDDDGVRYAINERPMNDGIVRIGFTASQSGEYTLDVARMDTEVVLYDAEMNVVHDFKNGAYAFYSDKGTFEDRFTLGVPNNETTGVEEVELEQVVEVVEGGIAFSADATATIYNAAGVAVAKQQGAGTVMLQPGVYVVSVGNKNLKVVVK